MPKKKVVIERKFRKTKRKIVIGIILLCVGNMFLLACTLYVILHKPSVASPLPVDIVSNNKLFSTTTQVDQTKNLLNKYAIVYDTVSEENDVIKVQLKQGYEAWLSSNKNLEQQIASLQLTINHFTIVGKVIKKIDLRFDKPVVSF